MRPTPEFMALAAALLGPDNDEAFAHAGLAAWARAKAVQLPALRDLPVPLRLAGRLIEFTAQLGEADWATLRETQPGLRLPFEYATDWSCEALDEAAIDVVDHLCGPEAEVDALIEQTLLELPSRRVLDYGAGAGRFAFALAGAGVAVDAIESNPVKARFVDWAAGRDGYGHLRTVAAPAGRYDAALAINVFDHLADPAAAIRDLARRLPPGAKLVHWTAFGGDGDHNHDPGSVAAAVEALQTLFEAAPRPDAACPFEILIRRSRLAAGWTPAADPTPRPARPPGAALRIARVAERKAWLERAGAEEAAERWDLALALYRTLLSREPGDGLVRGGLVSALFESGRRTQAAAEANADALVLVIDGLSRACGLEETFSSTAGDLIRARGDLLPDPGGKATRGGLQSGELLAPGADELPQILSRALQHGVGVYCREVLGIPALEGTLMTAWAVELGAGGLQVPHNHPDGVLSGVYYLDVPAPADADAERSTLVFTPSPRRPGADHSAEFRVEARTDRCVVFPSYMWHYTTPTPAPGGRLSVAFDLVPVSRPGH